MIDALTLTEQEWMIVSCLSEGMKNHEIAEQMGITVHRIKNYLKVIYDKLGFYNRVEIALWYVNHTYKGAE